VLAHHPRLFVFPPGYGYDGQFYHAMAHDPLVRTDAWRHLDDPRLRYRRILAPLAAWLMSLGQGRFVDAAYDVVLAAAVFLGAWAFGTVARLREQSAGWGAFFLLVPATAISMDRMTPDVVLAALTAALGVAILAGRQRLALAMVLLAPLVRETGWLLPLGYGASLLLTRDWRRAGLVAAAGLPAVAWYAYVHHVLPAQPYPLLALPLQGMWSAAFHPPSEAAAESLAGALMRAAGLMALCGMMVAFAWSAALVRRDPRAALSLVALCFALIGIVVQRPDHWYAAHDYGRVYSPLLVILGLEALARGSAWPLLPIGLVWPRLALEMRGEVMGVVRGIL
jgi:hypothetical protein